MAASSPAPRFDADELRRFAVASLSAAGVPSVRASAIVAHLLWYDRLGQSRQGVERLGAILEGVAKGAFDPAADVRIVRERPGTATIEVGKAVPELALGRAAELAVQKARDVGSAIVRLAGEFPDDQPTAAVAAAIALGPEIGQVTRRDGSGSIAYPTVDAPPTVLEIGRSPKDGRPSPDQPAPAVGLLQAPGELIVSAVSIAAFEPIERFLERLKPAESPKADRKVSGRGRNAAADATGIAVHRAEWERLVRFAQAAGVDVPEPLSTTRAGKA